MLTLYLDEIVFFSQSVECVIKGLNISEVYKEP